MNLIEKAMENKGIEMNELAVLSFDPFEGDFGSPFDRRLEDKIVINRKDHICTFCNQPSRKGEISRVIAEIFWGEFGKYRYCEACCLAMEAWETKQDYEPWKIREEIRGNN